MAPELAKSCVDGQRKHNYRSRSADVYSFGCVTYQVCIPVGSRRFKLTAAADMILEQLLSRKLPYFRLDGDIQVIIHIYNGNCLDHLGDGLLHDAWWDCIQLCCSVKPDQRPGMDSVYEKLEGFRSTAQNNGRTQSATRHISKAHSW